MVPTSGTGSTFPELRSLVCGDLGSEAGRVKTGRLFWGPGCGGDQRQRKAPGARQGGRRSLHGEAILVPMTTPQGYGLYSLARLLLSRKLHWPKLALQQVGPEFYPREGEMQRQVSEKAGGGAVCGIPTPWKGSGNTASWWTKGKLQHHSL